MNYYSTRDRERAHGCSLREAAMMGLAPDGGLFVPERIPQADMALAERLAGESYAALAGYLAGLFFGGDFDSQAVQRELDGLYDFPVPLRVVGRGCYTLELFHGPTCAFKDFGAGFMGRMAGLLGAADEKLVILTATSGDTGSAVAHGFHNVPGVEVVVLYPEGKISRLQECQMTALGGNIHPLRVAGTFDDCQRLVKELFADAPFRKRRRVTSANSINLLRWIPQAFYYFNAYARLREAGLSGPIVVSVPSGNFGNLTAGLFAKRMGLPVKRFIAANNRNDIFYHYLQTGSYEPRPSVATIANAMDVGDPSNFARILDLYGRSLEAIRADISAARYDDEQICRAIAETLERTGYLLDPHGACGYLALCEGLREDETGVFLETAHPAKFRDRVEPVVGRSIEIPARLAEVMRGKKLSVELPADFGAFRDFLMAK